MKRAFICRSLRGAIIVILLVLLLSITGLVLVLGISLGVGWLLTLFLPFTLFEASLLAMVAFSIVGMTWYYLVRSLTDATPISYPFGDDDDKEDYLEYDEIPPAKFYKTKADKNWENWLRYQIANDIYIEFQDTPRKIAQMGDKQLQALAIRLADMAVSILKTKTARIKRLKITKAALIKQMNKMGQQPYDDDILQLAVTSINDNLDFYYVDIIEVIRGKLWNRPTDMFGRG